MHLHMIIFYTCLYTCNFGFIQLSAAVLSVFQICTLLVTVYSVGKQFGALIQIARSGLSTAPTTTHPITFKTNTI